MEFKEILELIRFVSKAGVSEVSLQKDNFKILIRTSPKESTGGLRKEQGQAQVTGAAQAPVLQSVMQPVTVVAAPPAAGVEQQHKLSSEAAGNKTFTVKAPMVGTFYRSPAPEKPPFINVGDMIKKGQVVCVIEAMKLFNEIESDVEGKITKILVDDAKPVEYDQPLFLVEAL